MKKIPRERRERVAAAGRLRWRKSLLRRGKKYLSSSGLPIITVEAPDILSFRKNFSATIEFLDSVRDVFMEHGTTRRRIHIDLAPIKQLSVPVAIVLAAEFHRWSLMLSKRLRVVDAHKWSPSVRSLLSDLGVFKLLSLGAVSNEHNAENFTLTELMSGVRTDGHKIDQLQEEFEDVLAGFTKKPEMYAGLMEAAENAINHAYPDGYVPTHPFAGHRWWAASCLDTEKMILRFFVFDQGAGIPHTLPTATVWEQVRAKIAVLLGDFIPNDSLMLKSALEVGRTRTGLDHRGLGLRRMSDVVTGAESGSLRILSGKGEIVYYSDERIEMSDHERHIGGTLIEWSMRADAFTDSSKDLPDEND
jgi:hypothetical protein